MLEYPVELIEFLNSRNSRIGEFEDCLDNFYEYYLDPHNDSPQHSNDLFFEKYYKLPYDRAAPDCVELFSILKDARLRNLKRPKFMLPVKLVTDIRMQKTVDAMIGTPVEWKSVFALPEMRKGQLELLKGLFESRAMNKIMAASTGLGKTWVMLAYASGKPTIIVEPDKGLQMQLKQKYGATILMGRGNYRCRDYNTGADISPCRFKSVSETTCDKGCPWYDAHHKAIQTLDSRGVVVTNSWNMWQFFRNVELIIFDEFHKILSELTVRYEIPREIRETTGLAYLQNKSYELEQGKDALLAYLTDDPEDSDKAREYNNTVNELQSLKIFLESYEGSYIYDDGEKRYLKLDKVKTMQYIATHYEIPKLFVSATPVHIPDADLILTSDSVSKLDNAPIVYYPVGKLTSQALKANPDNLKSAANVINTLFAYFSDHGITKKTIVHTGNTTTHMAIAEHLNMKYLKHTKGSLRETLEVFSLGTYDALLIASADAGYDFYGSDFGLQCILKIPYPTRNAEWTAIRNKFGEMYERNLYSQEAITQVIQAAGRICRGTEDMGMTVILDGKFTDLFNYNREKFPDDFANRIIDLSGELKHAVSREKIDYYQGVANAKKN